MGDMTDDELSMDARVEASYSDAETALAEALHRMDLPECEPDADDYSDEAEHRFVAHDLLDNLRAHGWQLVPVAEFAR